MCIRDRREDVARALTEAHEQAGRIDYVICTAGVLNKEPLTTMDYATIQAAVPVSYTHLCNMFLLFRQYLHGGQEEFSDKKTCFALL